MHTIAPIDQADKTSFYDDFVAQLAAVLEGERDFRALSSRALAFSMRIVMLTKINA
jgi:hypothetical protein